MAIRAEVNLPAYTVTEYKPPTTTTTIGGKSVTVPVAGPRVAETRNLPYYQPQDPNLPTREYEWLGRQALRFRFFRELGRATYHDGNWSGALAGMIISMLQAGIS